jgi:hypothetical protein
VEEKIKEKQEKQEKIRKNNYNKIDKLPKYIESYNTNGRNKAI